MKKAMKKALAVLLATLMLLGVGAVGAVGAAEVGAEERATAAEGEIVAMAKPHARSVWQWIQFFYMFGWFEEGIDHRATLWLAPIWYLLGLLLFPYALLSGHVRLR